MGSSEYRDLGMHRRIPRRDFLNGTALALTGFGIRASGFEVPGSKFQVPSSAASAAAYPPAATGLRGNYPDAVAAFGPMQQGAYQQFPSVDLDTREEYDLVIVGAGISGLAAAHFWRRALGPGQKILILDNHD